MFNLDEPFIVMLYYCDLGSALINQINLFVHQFIIKFVFVDLKYLEYSQMVIGLKKSLQFKSL